MGGYLIVGLGNPGPKYEKTRHNLGFVVVEAFAKKHGLVLKRGWRLKGKIVSGFVGEKKVHLLMPTTYMNLSGTAVRRAVNSYKIALDHMLVVVDDVYVRVGETRIRPSGSPGGHNGLKNIDALLKTQEYPRLRVGVGPENGKLLNRQEVTLEDYVLGQFSMEEQRQVEQAVDNSLSIIECWLTRDIEAASQLAGELNNRFK